MTDEEREYLLGSAALWLAQDLAACQVLIAGEPVARSRLHGNRLLAIGEPINGEPLQLDDRLALRVEGVRLDEEDLGAEDDLRIVTLDEFVAVEERGADALLGTQDSALIPEGGDVMVYGDGGVGKTTLVVDLGCHFAAGDELARDRGRSCVRVLVIENEGPRPLFRRKLGRKREAWSGSPVGDRLLVFEEPWGGFSYADPVWRQRLGEVIREREIDVVIVGPLTASGMNLPGTLQECREFIVLVNEVRDLRRSAVRQRGRPPREQRRQGFRALGRASATRCSTSRSRAEGSSGSTSRRPAGRASTTGLRCNSPGPMARASRSRRRPS